MNDCLFCKIINKEIKSAIIYEDANFLVFDDINPKAPLHWLIVPKKHSESPNDTSAQVLGNLIKKAADLAEKKGFSANGYRLIINKGDDGGQIVKHLHLHLLAQKKLDKEMVELPKGGEQS